MKIHEWGDLILSWANFLDPNEDIGSLEDLGKSNLFSRLLGALRWPLCQYKGDRNELITFLREQYPALDLESLPKDSKQTTILTATSFLIYCTLHHEENELQKKMTELPNWTQLCLTAFLQELVDIPKTEISQDLIFSEISKISSLRNPGSAMTSPNFGTPVMYTSSPSTEGSRTMSSSKKTSRIRRLRKEVEMLNAMKIELSEELDSAKEQISNLETTLHKKDQDLAKLRLELENSDLKTHVCEPPKNNSSEKSKLDKLKLEIEKLEQQKSSLEDEVILAQDEKAAVYEELQRVRDIAQAAEMNNKILKGEIMELEAQLKELNMTVEQLTLTNKEQSDYISELTRPKDDSKRFSDSHGDSLILPESLGQHVIDLEIRELKDIIETKDSAIFELKNEIKEKLVDQQSLELKICSLNQMINDKHMELELASKTISEKDAIIVSLQTSIDLLKDEMLSVKNIQNSLTVEVQTKMSYIKELLQEIDNLKKNVQTVMDEKDLLMDTISLKEAAFIKCSTELHDTRESFETKVSSLQSELDEKSSMCRSLEELRLLLNDELSSSKEQNNILENKLANMTDQLFTISEERQNLNLKLLENVEIIKSLEVKLKVEEEKLIETEQLKCKNEELHKEVIEQLKSDINKYVSELSGLEKANNDLNDELNSKNTTIENYESKLKFYETVNELVKSENKSLIEEVSSKEKLIDDLQSKCENYQADIAILEDEKVSLSEQLKVIETSYEKQIELAGKLQKEIEERLCNEMQLSEELQRQTEVILNLQNSVKTLENSLSVCVSDCERLKTDIIVLNEVIECSKNEVLDLQKVLEGKDSIIKSQEVALNESSEQIISLQEAEHNLKQKISLKDKEIEELNLQVWNHETSIKNANLQIERMTTELKLKSNEIEEHLNSIQTLQDDSKDKISVLNSEIEILKASNNELISEKEMLKSELENTHSAKEKVSSALKSLEIEHSSCSEKVQYLESVIREVKDKETILKEELHKANKRESTLESEVERKSADISNLEEEIKSLQNTLESSEFNEGILFTKLQAKEAEVNQMYLELSDVNKRFKLAEERHQEETKLHVQKIQDLDATIGLMNNQFIKINIEKETLITELENRKDIEKECKKLKADYEILESEKETLEKEIKMNCAQICKMQENCEKLERQIKDLENDKLDLKTATEAQVKELNDLKERILILQNEISKRENNEASLIHEVESKNEFISKLENEVSNLKKVHDDLKSQESTLKEVLRNKDSLIEKYSEEKNLLKLDTELFSKKEENYRQQLEVKCKEIEELNSKLKLNQDETEKHKVKCSEQEQTIRGLFATLHSQNSELKEKNTEITLLQDEVKSLNQLLIEEKANVARREQRKEEDRAKTTPPSSEEDIEIRLSRLKASYERKVEGYKATLKKRFAEKLEDLTYTLQNENTELKEKVLKEQERCAKLQSELWNASDKLLITQEQNRTLMSKFQNRNMFEVIRPSEALSPISKARSMEVLSGRNRGIDNFARDMSLNESDCSSRRASIRSLPRGMGKKLSFQSGKVFPAAEEDGEVFDNRYLADLKAGVCNVPFDPDRVSTLQYRNSLCPPHLKSSYPLEFIPTEVREDDIKSGSNRLPTSNSEGDIRRTKLQSSYKKPGPPTPSKSAGQLQCSEKRAPMTPKFSKPQMGKEGVVNESFVLRESNNIRSENPQRATKVATPSRLRALFTKRDENSPRRKSLFMRKN